MIRCVIIDDEPWANDLLRSYIGKVDYLNLLYATESPLDALNYLSTNEVDLLFLDIQMPELTGLQVLKLLEKNIKVILVTAYSEYAIHGYEHDVIDYLLKPIEFGRFYKAVQRAKDQIAIQSIAKEHGDKQNTPTRDFFFIKTDGRLVRVNYSDITYIEGLKDYISIHTSDGNLISLDSLIHMETVLPSSQFIRIHKSYIVNIEKIDAIERNLVYIGQQPFPIGPLYKEAVMKLWQQ